ncbi:RsmB/NOP family class I SAM-dependent RNA methyltransferase [Paroceanicella profunda]|uniref:RsmB/NOP family class I SAM-dependent RNA methyltransferase n=1 Tax=Paroceanicella profunda TaxID=2579971 RepID=A0A5B8G2A1_9RHOB|nr:RsmB/NOP family class I SAM-dependent RNA methyltransferase [Paroceanicella profunda]QDL92723.1 RsmB/NOP family class I SAM-dependent RNA methyltransferase [Paroceanicella profunda]
MTPAARLSAAIEVLDEVLAGTAADRALAAWGRSRRFAGAKDRAAIADLVYDALRCRRTLARLGGGETGRGLIVGLSGGQEALFHGAAHGPAPLTGAERAARLAPAGGTLPERLDFPDWMEAPLTRALGAELEPVMEALRHRAPLDLRVNLARATPEAACAALAEDGVRATPLPAEPAALRVAEGARALRRAAAYLDGRVEIQDLSSQRVARFAGALPGQTVLDYCAGGGGKTLALGMHMQGRGRLIAHDIAPARMKDLMPRATRAGLSVETIAPEGPGGGRGPALGCDLVLADAPCSGTGAWRRNPDAKWRLTQADLTALTRLQDRVLDAAARHVRPGGVLVFATCSLLVEENDDRVAAFLQRNREFAGGDTLRLTPLDGGDGFFAARLARRPAPPAG